MLARRFAIPLMLLLAVAGISVAVLAQLETGDRGARLVYVHTVGITKR